MNNKESVVKAVVCEVFVGLKKIEGLMLPDGSYGVAVPQIAILLETSINTMARDLKRLMGADFKALRGKTEFNNNVVLIVDLTTFKKIVLCLAQKGNEKAILFWNDAFPELMLRKKQQTKNIKSIGYIYLFEGANILKLGYSTNVESRLKHLSRWDGELEIVAKVKGTINKEKALHRTLHLTGDYFGDEWYPIYRKHEILQLLDIAQDVSLVKQQS